MRLLGSPRRLAVALLAAALGCAPAAKQSPPPPVAPPRPAAEGMRVEKVREELQLAPWDLAFSAVRGTGVATETVTARNLTDEPVTVRALPVLGDGALAVRAAQPAQAAGDRAAQGPALRRGDVRAAGERRAGRAPRAAAVPDRAHARGRPGHRSLGAGDGGPRRRSRADAGRGGRGAGLRRRRAQRARRRTGRRARGRRRGPPRRRRGARAAVHARGAVGGGAEPGGALLRATARVRSVPTPSRRPAWRRRRWRRWPRGSTRR